jgi:hypothetical protein
VDSEGRGVATVSQVFWRWAGEPGGTWSLVERIHLWNTCEQSPEACHNFENALFSALDLENS